MSVAHTSTLDSLVSHATAYATAGLGIFPVNPRDKTPLISQYKATTDPAQIGEWWRRWPTALIGHRISPDVVILDIDPRHGGDQVWRALLDEFPARPVTRWHRSGRGDGGGHTWWRRPADKTTVTHLDQWARERGLGHAIESSDRWTCGIDILHHTHRYTILPPSPHPDTGQPYTWATGGLDTVVAAMPALLADLITHDPAPTIPAAPPRAPDPDSIADWYSTNHTWDALLTRHGWTLRAGDGNHDGSRWRHPTATTAFSATIRHSCLFVYSPNTPFEVTSPSDPHGYTLYRAYATLDHAGDLQAAGRAARTAKDGPPAVDDLTWIDAASNPAPAPAEVDEPPTANGQQPNEGKTPIGEATVDDVLAHLAAHTSWAPIDLAAVAAGLQDGTLTAPEPDIGAVTGTALGLFYRARINGLYAKGGDGKSWIALLACAERLAGGDTVWWIDFEDNEIGLTSRLLALGVDTGNLGRFRYYRPNDPLDPLERALLVRLAALEQPVAIVIDSTGESMAVHGVKPNADEEVARWFQTVAKPLADTGAAVIAIDHLPHDADGRLSAIGSTRKYNAVSGSAYVVKVLAEFGRDRVGRSALTCAKDRWGHHVRGKIAAEFTLDATRTIYSAELALPLGTEAVAHHPLAEEKPAVRRVYDAMADASASMTTAAIGDIVATDPHGIGLKKRTIQDALARLEELGIAAQEGTNEKGAYLWIRTDVTESLRNVHAHPYAHLPGAHGVYDEEF